MDEQKILPKLREICLALPGASETVMFGHPTFQAGKMNAFAVLERCKGELSVSFKVGKAMQSIFLDDPRFFKTPYVGRHGWVSLRVNGRLDWKEITELAKGSHQLITGNKR
jgi:predicted DNA-binding protein (MmcQ/YjbR family)